MVQDIVNVSGQENGQENGRQLSYGIPLVAFLAPLITPPFIARFRRPTMKASFELQWKPAPTRSPSLLSKGRTIIPDGMRAILIPRDLITSPLPITTLRPRAISWRRWSPARP